MQLDLEGRQGEAPGLRRTRASLAPIGIFPRYWAVWGPHDPVKACWASWMVVNIVHLFLGMPESH